MAQANPGTPPPHRHPHHLHCTATTSPHALPADGLPDDFEPAHYFYAYACRKAPLVLGGTQLAAAAAAAQAGAGAGAGARAEPRPAARAIAEGVEGRVRLPEGWCNTVRAVAQAIRADVGLPPVSEPACVRGCV